MAINMPVVTPVANDKIVDKNTGKSTSDLTHANGFADAMGDAKTHDAASRQQAQAKPSTTASAKPHAQASNQAKAGPDNVTAHGDKPTTTNQATAAQDATAAVQGPGGDAAAALAGLPLAGATDIHGKGEPAGHDQKDSAKHAKQPVAGLTALIPGLVQIANTLAPGQGSDATAARPVATDGGSRATATLDTLLVGADKSTHTTAARKGDSSAQKSPEFLQPGLTRLAQGSNAATTATSTAHTAGAAFLQTNAASAAQAPGFGSATGSNVFIQALTGNGKSNGDSSSGPTQILAAPGANGLMPTGLHGNNAAAAPATSLPSPVGSPPWHQELGQVLIQLGQTGQHEVKLHLHPAELGTLQVTLQIHHDTAQAQFLVNQAQVRDAVQQALPQLRQALASQGIALGQASVGQQSQQFAQPQHGSGSRHRGSNAAVGGVTESAASAPPQVMHVVHGRSVIRGVDTWA